MRQKNIGSYFHETKNISKIKRGEKMKKTIILFLSLILVAMPVSLSATTYLDVQNESKAESQTLTHAVARISTFKYTPKTSVINYDAAGINIASISVINNTIDGFNLVVSSAQGGVLSPASTLDGEQDIPYGLSIDAIGTLGTGADAFSTIATSALSDPASPANLLTVTSEQSSPTSLAMDINVTLASTVEDQMSMAGTYSDTLTFTYTDF
jgi:hypothetical protein